MRILVVGAGPAGLSFAVLMAKADPSHEITVVEGSAPGQHPGLGLTLLDRALPYMGLAGRLVTEKLEGRASRYGGKLIVDLANPPDGHLVTFPRAGLIAALVAWCSEFRVRMRFQVDAASLSDEELAGWDLVAAADGANSALRQRFRHTFKPATTLGRNRFAWLGAEVPFPKLTMLLRGGDVPLLAWAYRYAAERSTFIVECSDQAAERAGFVRGGVEASCAAVADVFASELGGAKVFGGGPLSWQHFATTSCERLHHDNVVLLGDAAHPMHFSQGFGTIFAFDDALVLHDALRRHGEVAKALRAYEAIQRPKIAAFQTTASASMAWAECLVAANEDGDEASIRAILAGRWPDQGDGVSPLSASMTGRRPGAGPEHGAAVATDEADRADPRFGESPPRGSERSSQALATGGNT